MWHDHLLNTLIKTQMWFSSKKENAENNLHCKTLSSHWSFSYYKDFYMSFVSFFILGELQTYNWADHWKRFLNTSITLLKGNNPLKKTLSFIKMLHFIQSSASNYSLRLLTLPSALFTIPPFWNRAHTLQAFLPCFFQNSLFLTPSSIQRL